MHRVSPEMFSWFPLFFPFKEPLYLPGGSELEVNIWRLTSGKKIWYEWCAEAFLPFNSGAGDSTTSTTGLGATPGGGGGPQRSLSLGMGSLGGGGGQLSPMMDAPHSPMPGAGAGAAGATAGVGAGGAGAGGEGRIKIGQTSLHNPGGASSWVGL